MPSRRLRRTPYTDRVEAAGVDGYSVYNHMLLPKSFGMTAEEAYRHLHEHVQIWDVAAERQVEVTGPDAAWLVQWMTPRDLRRAKVGRCYYAPIVDADGGMLNDPVLLKLAEDRYWLSIADSDLLLWVKGLIAGRGLDARAFEPDVSPLAVQGPKAEAVMVALFGEAMRELKFYGFTHVEFEGTGQLVARSGYSSQDGFEIYLDGAHLGPALWDAVMAAGRPHSIAPGAPIAADWIEAGMLGYGTDMNAQNDPLEMGLGKLCRLDGEIECVGLEALRRIAADGPARVPRGVRVDLDPCPPLDEAWPLTLDGEEVGRLGSAVRSPRFGETIGLALMKREAAEAEGALLHLPDGRALPARLCDVPFT